MSWPGLCESDNIKRMITLTVITLRGAYCSCWLGIIVSNGKYGTLSVYSHAILGLDYYFGNLEIYLCFELIFDTLEF